MSNYKKDGYGCDNCYGTGYGNGYDRGYDYDDGCYKRKNCDECYRVGYEECEREAFRGKIDAERRVLNDHNGY